MHHESTPTTDESSGEFVIDSLQKLVHYLGAVALYVPESVVKILGVPHKK